ncbi:P0 [Ornithogalum virus 5]|uniref:P0 n=1 Tax=Ornithogalum virus 5 TaxID=2653665 RepID=A0A648N482_9VIRU|nr:P0 [Ornithogalum virus 5]
MFVITPEGIFLIDSSISPSVELLVLLLRSLIAFCFSAQRTSSVPDDVFFYNFRRSFLFVLPLLCGVPVRYFSDGRFRATLDLLPALLGWGIVTQCHPPFQITKRHVIFDMRLSGSASRYITHLQRVDADLLGEGLLRYPELLLSRNGNPQRKLCCLARLRARARFQSTRVLSVDSCRTFLDQLVLRGGGSVGLLDPVHCNRIGVLIGRLLHSTGLERRDLGLFTLSFIPSLYTLLRPEECLEDSIIQTLLREGCE